MADDAPFIHVELLPSPTGRETIDAQWISRLEARVDTLEHQCADLESRMDNARRVIAVLKDGLCVGMGVYVLFLCLYYIVIGYVSSHAGEPLSATDPEQGPCHLEEGCHLFHHMSSFSPLFPRPTVLILPVPFVPLGDQERRRLDGIVARLSAIGLVPLVLAPGDLVGLSVYGHLPTLLINSIWDHLHHFQLAGRYVVDNVDITTPGVIEDLCRLI